MFDELKDVKGLGEVWVFEIGYIGRGDGRE